MAFALDITPESAPSLSSRSRLPDESDRASRRLRRRFLDLVRRARGRVTVKEVEQLLNDGDLGEIFAIVEDIGPAMSSSVESVFLLAAALASGSISQATGRSIGFDASQIGVTNELAEIRQIHFARIENSQQTVLQDVLEDGFQRNLSNRSIAEELLLSIGLTVVGYRAVQNFRSLLERGSSQALARELRDRRFDRTIERAISSRTPLTAAQITRMTNRYRENQIKARARTIGLSSGNAAVHGGDSEMFRQAMASGAIVAEDIDQIWLTRQDSLVRSSHRPMDQQGRPFGVAFLSGAGNLLRYPGDLRAPFRDRIGCRCFLFRRLR